MTADRWAVIAYAAALLLAAVLVLAIARRTSRPSRLDRLLARQRLAEAARRAQQRQAVSDEKGGQSA